MASGAARGTDDTCATIPLQNDDLRAENGNGSTATMQLAALLASGWNPTGQTLVVIQTSPTASQSVRLASSTYAYANEPSAVACVFKQEMALTL